MILGRTVLGPSGTVITPETSKGRVVTYSGRSSDVVACSVVAGLKRRAFLKPFSSFPGKEESFDPTTNSYSLTSPFVGFIGGLSDVLLCK